MNDVRSEAAKHGMQQMVSTPPGRVVSLVGQHDDLYRQLRALAPGLDCTVLRHADPDALDKALSRERRPTIVVIDTDHAMTTGLMLIARVRETERAPIILIDGDNTAATAVKALKKGAIDYLARPVPDEVLSGAMRDALDVATAPTAAQLVAATAEQLRQLTRRERQVLDGLLDGLTSKGIARRLGISHRTVEVHRSRVMQKMHAHNLAELILLVQELRRARSRAAVPQPETPLEA